jgi:DNA polymerase-4
MASLDSVFYDLSRGQDERQVIPSRRRKSLSVEHTYPEDLPDLAHCLNQFPELLQTLAGRLRRWKTNTRL